MNNTHLIMSIIFGGILFGIFLFVIWIIFRNVKKRMMPRQHSSPPAIFIPETPESERRKHPRIGIHWSVMMNTPNGMINGKTKDLSLGGAFIRCQNPLPLKDQFTLTITPPTMAPIMLTAEVVWSNANVPEHMVVNRGMGIHFIQESDENIQYLKSAIDDYIEKRGA